MPDQLCDCDGETGIEGHRLGCPTKDHLWSQDLEGPIPPIGSKVLVEATVVAHNLPYFRDVGEGPPLPIPCVKVRDGILLGVRCEDLVRLPRPRK